MKIFSFFGKKPRTQDNSQPETVRASNQTERSDNSSARSNQRNIARATELKIDAIELAMSLHLDRDHCGKDQPDRAFQNTVPLTEVPTEILFDDAPHGSGMLTATLPTPVIEEAAILFANNQQALAEQLLQNAILEAAPAPHAEHAYLLLFDLYHISCQRQAFDKLATDYINRFETSPPTWRDAVPQTAPIAPAAAHPGVAFPAALDGNCTTQVERAQQLSAASQVLRLDFSRIHTIDATGCALLLQLLLSLHKSSHDLILPGAPALIGHLKSILRTEPPAASAAPWLLLLELLRLLNREQEFEESSIEYCIAFEISPPAFEAPKVQVALTGVQNSPASPNDRFMMPTNVAGDMLQLIESIAEFAAGRDTVVIDCSLLNRIEFSASGQLLTGLVPLAGNGKAIEFHEVNYLVAALLNVMGLKEIARIIPHKG